MIGFDTRLADAVHLATWYLQICVSIDYCFRIVVHLRGGVLCDESILEKALNKSVVTITCTITQIHLQFKEVTRQQ